MSKIWPKTSVPKKGLTSTLWVIYQYVLHRVYQQADNIVSLWVVSGFLKKQKRIRKNTKYKNSYSESTKEYKPAKELWKWNKIFLKKNVCSIYRDKESVI